MVTFYYWLGSLIILAQVLSAVFVLRNSRYALNKYKKRRSWYRPRTAVIIPCKGIDIDFDNNIKSFFEQDYNNFLLWFVVESQEDPAYERLCRLEESFAPKSQALEIKIWVAGTGTGCSQKIHNLLYCCERVPDDVEVLAFADSDIYVREDWLSHLVYPLRQEKNGVASGYRWFIPKRNNIPTVALSAGNAKVAQLLGSSIFNQAWGGSMAVRKKVFEELNIQKVWLTALSDDLSLSESVKRAGFKVAFVPACMAASLEDTNWPRAFEFVRRQFLITKVFSPGTWWFSIITMTGSVVTTWGSVGAAVWAAAAGRENLWFFIAVPVLALLSQLSRACMRQFVATRLLHRELERMKLAVVADIFFFWLWSIILWALIASTSIGRTVCWRGVRYKMLSPTKTIVLKD